MGGGERGSSAGQVPGLVLVFSNGAARALAIPIGTGEVELGRGAALLGEHQDLRMSRRHARIRHEEGRFWVTDLGSQNGTFIEGEQATAGRTYELERVLRMGDSLLVPCRDVRPLSEQGIQVRDGLVRGPRFQALLTEVARAARTGTTLHIHGESGTGKEGVARAFHESGANAAGPFVAVNCAAVPEGVAERLLFGAKRGAYSGADADTPGYLQAADQGTLFLDEVVELDLAVQAKLLRVLETREVLPLGASRPRKVEIQVCSASNRDLRALVSQGRLREDLYYRIGRPSVSLPPLRDRPEEIPQLVQAEIARAAPGVALHVSLVEACLLRPWPGNVRELLVESRSAAQMALLEKAPRVELRHLAPSAGTVFGAPLPPPAAETPGAAAARPPTRSLDDALRVRIEEALRQQHGNVAATARALGMHRTQLRRLLTRYGITVAAETEEDAE
jgi:DNA-binding NtrC family response regulator